MKEMNHSLENTSTTIEFYAGGYLSIFPWQQKLIEPAAIAGLNISLLTESDSIKEYFIGLNNSISFNGSIRICFRQAFFNSEQNIPYNDFTFIRLLNESVDFLKKGFEKLEDVATLSEYSPSNIIMTFCVSDEILLYLKFDLYWNEIVQQKAWSDLTTIVKKIKSRDEETIKWINSLHVQENKLRFLYYDLSEAKWQLFDRLLAKTEEICYRFRDQINDRRVHKPHVIFNESNYYQHFILGKQWMLRLEELHLIMEQPNDVALYVQLAEKNLRKAKDFFDKEYADRSKRFYQPLLRTKEMLEYYDYFEAIIAAITFSYTSLETFANICIPEGFTYEETNDEFTKIFSKEGIERRFALRDKFKKIMPLILKSPDPSKEPWWMTFCDLEQIRNEIIHTKQSKSQDRYSLFLSKKIFELISVNKEIITYYGGYINQNAKNLLILYPFGFGFDSVPPAFIGNDGYISSQRQLRGSE